MVARHVNKLGIEVAIDLCCDELEGGMERKKSELSLIFIFFDNKKKFSRMNFTWHATKPKLKHRHNAKVELFIVPSGVRMMN